MTQDDNIILADHLHCRPGLSSLLSFIERKIALGKENQCNEKTNKNLHVFSQTAFEILHKGRQNIKILRNKEAEFPLLANRHFYDHVLIYVHEYLGIECQTSGRGGNQAGSRHPLPGSLHGTHKVGQPTLRASLAIDKSKNQPATKVVICTICMNLVFAQQPWYCISPSKPAHRVNREQGC